MRYVCPQDVKKTDQVSALEEVGCEARVRRIEGRGSSQLWLYCERKQTKSGLERIETLPGNWFWKEAGCRKDSSTLVGRMEVNATPVTRRKAQKSTGFTIAQNGTRSDGRSQAESKILKGGVEVAKWYCYASSQ